MRISGLEFERTCTACPEQYDVFLDDRQVGYVRLRYGKLTVDYPDCLKERIYSTNIGGEWTGEFQSDEQRLYYLGKIAGIIYDRMEEEFDDVVEED